MIATDWKPIAVVVDFFQKLLLDPDQGIIVDQNSAGDLSLPQFPKRYKRETEEEGGKKDKEEKEEKEEEEEDNMDPNGHSHSSRTKSGRLLGDQVDSDAASEGLAPSLSGMMPSFFKEMFRRSREERTGCSRRHFEFRVHWQTIRELCSGGQT